MHDTHTFDQLTINPQVIPPIRRQLQKHHRRYHHMTPMRLIIIHLQPVSLPISPLFILPIRRKLTINHRSYLHPPILRILSFIQRPITPLLNLHRLSLCHHLFQRPIFKISVVILLHRILMIYQLFPLQIPPLPPFRT